MKRPSPFDAAVKEWRKLEKLCASSAKTGTAFLTNDEGELLLHEGRPVLSFVFGRAWQALKLASQLAAEAGEEPPPAGISLEYREWPSIEPLTEWFLAFADMAWSEVDASFLERFEDQPAPRATATISALE